MPRGHGDLLLATRRLLPASQPPAWRPNEHSEPEEAVVYFSKPTLDSVHTEPACVWSLGRLHGSSISIRLEGEEEEKNTFKRQSKSVIGF